MNTHHEAFCSPRPENASLKLVAASATFAVSLKLGQTVWAGDDHHHKRDLNIIEVFVTFDDNAYGGVDTITINGEDLDFGRSPTVTLGRFPAPLEVLNATDTEIVVACPTTITGTTCPSGGFLLSVSTGRGKRKNDEWDLSIGAVGPQGEPGPAGEQGPSGNLVLIGQCPVGEFVTGFDASGFVCSGGGIGVAASRDFPVPQV